MKVGGGPHPAINLAVVILLTISIKFGVDAQCYPKGATCPLLKPENCCKGYQCLQSTCQSCKVRGTACTGNLECCTSKNLKCKGPAGNKVCSVCKRTGDCKSTADCCHNYVCKRFNTLGRISYRCTNKYNAEDEDYYYYPNYYYPNYNYEYY